MSARSSRIAATLVVAAVLGACGEDEAAPADAGTTPTTTSESCPQVGMTMTGCACPGPPGVRYCTEDLVWTECDCPPAFEPGKCGREGQMIPCMRCPGEIEGRIVPCQADLTYDCSCPMDAGAADGGMGLRGCTPDTQCEACPADPGAERAMPCYNPGLSCDYAPSCGGGVCDCRERDGGAPYWDCYTRPC